MNYPVRVIAAGSFHEDDIIIHQHDLPPLPPDVEARVETVWASEVARNPHLTPGPLLVATSVTVSDDDRLLIHCGVSDYKKFMGTTHETVAPYIAEQHQHRAIGILAVTITADNYFLLGVRSPRIDWGTLRHVVPAGRLRPGQDPYTGIRTEYAEELGLQPAEIKDLICTGVVADQTFGRLNYECCFQANTTLTARQVITRAMTAKSAGEHSQLEPFPWSETFIRELLLADPDGFVPTGWASLVLCLDDMIGKNLFPGWDVAHRTYAEHMGRRLAMVS